MISFTLADRGDSFLVLAPFYYNFKDDFGLKSGVNLIPVYQNHGKKLSECFNDALIKARKEVIF